MARNFHHKVTVVKVNKGVARFLIVRKAKAIGIPAIVYLAKIVKAVAKLVNKTFGLSAYCFRYNHAAKVAIIFQITII